MFPKITTSKGHNYLIIAESFRDEKGKSRQRSLASLGRLDTLFKGGKFKKLLKALNNISDSNNKLFYLEEAEETERIYWGAYSIIRKLWDQYNFDSILSEILKDKKVQFDVYEAVFLMLVDRFAFPCSKLQTFKKQKKFNNKEEVELHQFYRSLDILANNKEVIEMEIFNKNSKDFNMLTNVVFYDVTTLHFESVISDELKKFGFSKNCKFGEVQIVLGLLMSQEGMPIGYEIFPGNLYEGSTLKTAINNLKNRFKIGKLIFIADQGMLSLENINVIRTSGYEYIIGSRIKNKPEKIKAEVLDLSDYEIIPTNEEDAVLKCKVINNKDKTILTELLTLFQKNTVTGDLLKQAGKLLKQFVNSLNKKKVNGFIKDNIRSLLTLKKLAEAKDKKGLQKKLEEIKNTDFVTEITKVLEVPEEFNKALSETLLRKTKELVTFLNESLNEKIVITWSSKRASKNKKDRDRLIEKAKSLIINKKPVISKTGYRKYINLVTGQAHLDEDKIILEEQWDGFFGIQSNSIDLAPSNICSMYHLLWKIEESFRILKSHFEARPIFHFTPNKIKGHLVLCYIAFVLERFLEIQLNKNNKTYSYDKIREAITSLQASKIKINEQEFYLTSKASELAADILKILKIEEPPRVTKEKFYN